MGVTVREASSTAAPDVGLTAVSRRVIDRYTEQTTHHSEHLIMGN